MRRAGDRRPDPPAVAPAAGDGRGGRLDGSPARSLGAPVRCSRRVPEGGRRQMNTPPIVSPQEWDAAREEMLVKEKELTRARDALAAERRRMPRMAVEKDYEFEGPDGKASLARPVRRAPPADRLPVLLRPGHGRVPRARLRRLLVHGRPGVAPVPPQRPRHHAGVRVAGAAGGDPAAEGQMGWDMPWFTITDDFDADHGVDEWHGTNAFIRDGRRRLPHLLRRQPRRRAVRHHVELPRRDGARAPGGVGGLARGLPADRRRTSGGTTTTPTRTRHDRPRVRRSRSRSWCRAITGAARAAAHAR